MSIAKFLAAAVFGGALLLSNAWADDAPKHGDNLCAKDNVGWREVFYRKDLTLQDIRGCLVGKEAIVGYRVNGRYPGALMGMSEARKVGSKYESVLESVSTDYFQTVATVVAVQLSDSSAEEPNALGEVQSDAEAVNPLVVVYLRLNDGSYAAVPGESQDFATGSNLDFPADRKRVIDQIERIAPSIVGTKVFGDYYSNLYKTNTGLREIRLDFAERTSPKRLTMGTDYKALTPMTITKAVFVSGQDGIGIAMKLSLDGGKEAIAFTDFSTMMLYRFLGPGRKAYPTDAELVPDLTGDLHQEMPENLSQREIEAIQEGKIFVGMSRGALGHLSGLPEDEKTVNAGETRLLFKSGLQVYLDADNKVTNWQTN